MANAAKGEVELHCSNCGDFQAASRCKWVSAQPLCSECFKTFKENLHKRFLRNGGTYPIDFCMYIQQEEVFNYIVECLHKGITVDFVEFEKYRSAMTEQCEVRSDSTSEMVMTKDSNSKVQKASV